MEGKLSLLLPRSARVPWPVPVIGSPTCLHLSQVVVVSGILVSLRAMKRAEASAFTFLSGTRKKACHPALGRELVGTLWAALGSTHTRSWAALSSLWKIQNQAGEKLFGRWKNPVIWLSYAKHSARSFWSLSSWSWGESMVIERGRWRGQVISRKLPRCWMSQQRRAGYQGYQIYNTSQGRLLGGRDFWKGMKSHGKIFEGKKGKNWK